MSPERRLETLATLAVASGNALVEVELLCRLAERCGLDCSDLVRACEVISKLPERAEKIARELRPNAASR